MWPKKSLPAVCLLFACIHSRASAQALPTATGPGTSVKVGAAYSIYHLEYGQRYLGGAQVWADGNLYWRVGLEAEARRLRQHEDLATHADTYLAGPRLSLRPGNFEPYVKVLAGLGRFQFPYNDARGNYLVVEGGGGIDLHIGKRLQFRAFDVEYQKWPQFTFGSMSSFGVSSGLSIVVYKGPSWLAE